MVRSILPRGQRAVDAAIDHGINLFDVAPYYGRTLAEERLGRFLQGKRHSRPKPLPGGEFDAPVQSQATAKPERTTR